MPRRRGDDPGYMGAGDGLRAIASLSVVLFHVYIALAVLYGTDYGAFGKVALHLNAGLYVFFVLSGYLVGGPFVRAWLNGGPWPSVRRYAGKRVRRIVPAFWVVFAALLVWFGDLGATKGEVLAVFGFAQTYDPGPVDRLMPQAWTLDIEMAFYLALPLLAGLTTWVAGFPSSARARRRLLFGAFGAVLVGGLVLRSGGVSESNASTNLATLGWAFVPGLALAALEQPLRARLAGTGVGRVWAAAAASGAACAFGVLMAANPKLDTAAANVAFLVVGGGVVAAPMLWQWTTGAAPRWLDSRPMHALGRWSYGIYLVHVGIGLELLKHVPTSFGANKALVFMAAGMIILSLAAAALLWWLVEQPCIERRAPRLPRWLPEPGTRRLSAEEADGRGLFIAGDALRALASFAVVAAHVCFAVALIYGKSSLDVLGLFGELLSRFTPVVYIFFAMSGYLVGGPFVRAWLRGGEWPSIRRYASRRVRRIVPGFVAICALLLAYFGPVGASNRQVVLLFLFGQSFDAGGVSTWMPQGWTLDVEVLFYLALPLSIVLVSRTGLMPRSEGTRRRILYAVLLATTVSGIAIRSLVHDPTGAGGRNVIALGHAFAPGMLLAAIEPQVRERLRGTALGKLAAYALLAVLICGYAAVVAFGLTDGQFAFEVAALAVGAGALGAPMVWQWATGRAPALMDSRVLTALGRWSYSIYLVHVGALLIVIRHVPSELGPSGAFAFVFVATSAISVAFATLMWWLVEEPLMLKRAPRAWWRSMRAVAARPQPPTEEQDTAEVVLGRTPAPAGAPTDA